MKIKLFLCFALVLGVFGSGDCDAKLIYVEAPAEGQKIVYTCVNEALEDDLPAYNGTQLKDLTLFPPYPIYGLGLTNLAGGHFIPTAKSGCWIYLFLRGSNGFGQTWLMKDLRTGKWVATGLSQSFFPNAQLDALRMAEQLPRVQKEDYEVRGLDCMPLVFHAIWLHSKTDDIIIPLPFSCGRWQAYLPYSEWEMLILLKPEAEKKLAQPPGFD